MTVLRLMWQCQTNFLNSFVDYDSAGYSLNIPARQTSVTRSVSITMDGVGGETPPETFNNSISSINTVSVADGPAEATVQIMDSDGEEYNCMHTISWIQCGRPKIDEHVAFPRLLLHNYWPVWLW